MAVIDNKLSRVDSGIKVMACKETERQTFGLVVYPRGRGPTRRHTDVCQLIFLHGGRMHLYMDGAEHVVTGGKMFMMRPGVEYEYSLYPEGSSKFSWIEFKQLTFLTPEKQRQVDCVPVGIPMPDSLKLGLKALQAYAREGHIANDQAFNLQGESILKGFFCAARPYMKGKQPIHYGVERALVFMDENLDSEITLRDIARQAHVAPEYLVRLFKKEGLSSPMASLWRKRIEKATFLLRTSDFMLADISAYAGFKNEHHFSRKIKTTTGLPPGQYRRAHQKQN